MRIAAAQIEVGQDKTKNCEKILSSIHQARNADVICFPELSLQSDEHNIQPIGRDLKKICTAAKENSIHVIFGAYVNEKKTIRNKLFVIDKQGKIIHQYNKRHPYKTEKDYVVSGKTNKVFSLDDTPCALINCWDYAYPEYLRSLARKGAVIFFCPSYLVSFPQTHTVLDKIPQVRAFDTMSYFVMVDAVAPDTYKRSRICHPLHQLAFIKDNEQIIYVDVDKEAILALREAHNNF